MIKVMWHVICFTSCVKKQSTVVVGNQTHGSVSAAKKTGKKQHRTQVCYLCAP